MGGHMVDKNVWQTPNISTDNPNKGTSYANLFTGVSIKKSVNFRTLFTPKGNGVDVVLPVESIRAISERFANTAYGLFLGKCVAYPIVVNYNPDVNLLKEDVGNVPVWVKLHGVPVTAFSEDGLSAIATKIVLIEVQADVELKDNIVVAMPKLTGEGFYTCNVHDECPKNKVSDVVKNMKKPSQTHKGVPVGPKVGFQPTKQVYRHVSKKNNVSTSVENDVDLGTNGRTSNLTNTKANSSGFSFWNAESSSTCTTPIVEKIDKMERLIIDGSTTLVDDEGIPLKMVDSSGDHDSDDEVVSVDNNMANFLASKDVGYGTNSLLEQYKESYGNRDYDYDPYDDNMYEGHDIPDKIQDICDNLDIKVRGRKKK
ncbi:hypothetical protein Tco_0950720 [Tanacetum coccineum]